MVTQEEIERVARRAADQAVETLLLRLGVDSDKKSLQELRDDLRYVHALRHTSGIVGKSSIWAVTALIVTTIGAVIWVGVKMTFGAGSH